MEGVETVRVTDITTGSAFTKSIGSLFSSINKSVSSAFNSLMAVPAATGTSEVPRTTAGTPTQPGAAAPVHTELDMTSIDQQQQQRQQQQQLAHDDRAYQQVDAAEWRRVHPQSYAEPSAYRGRNLSSVVSTARFYKYCYNECLTLIDLATFL